MSPFLMILLALLVVYFVSGRKQDARSREAARAASAPLPEISLEEGCWSCTPEDLLDHLSQAVRSAGQERLPVYVYGQGYEVRDLRRWVTLLTAPDGRLAEA